MTLKLVVFDVDGTLVDSQADILASMGRAFASEGLEAPPRAAALGLVGLALPLAIARLLPGADDAQVGRMVAVYKDTYADTRLGQAGGSQLYPGAQAALDWLKRQDEVLLGIATGKSRRGMFHVIESFGLSGLFQTLQCGDDHPSKPHPAMLFAALAETGVAAADTVFVGDTSFDIEMAQAAGVAGLGVSWGYHRPDALAEAGAVRVIDRFDALEGALQAIWGAGHG